MNRCKLLRFLPILLLVLASCSRDPKVQAQRYVNNGNTFFTKGKYKEAQLMYRRALQKDMRFGEAYYRLGLVDLKLQAYADAARALRRAVELQPNNTDAITQLANLLLLAVAANPANNEPLLNDLKDLTDKLLQQNPSSFDGHRLKGQIALLNKNPGDAIKEFDQANRVKPYDTGLVLAYFQALVLNNQFPEAEKLARDLIDKQKDYSPIYDVLYMQYLRQQKYPEAEALLKLKCANNPKNARYLLQLAGHYYYSNKRPEMDAVMQKLSDEKEYPEGRLLAGDFYFFRLKEFENARLQYEAAVKAFPKDKAVYQKRLVELYATTGKGTEANQLLATILKENPKDNDAIAMRAALMLSTGNKDQIDQATNDLQSLVAKSPNNHLYHYNLARALVAKNQLEPAKLQLQEAIKIRTDFMIAREMLAKIYLAQNQPAKALKEADDIITLDRNSLQGHLVRSAALLAVGDKDKARAELDYITRAYPHNADARFQVGYLAYQDKDYKRAEQVFGELYKENPRDLRGLVGVTQTMASQNRIGDAIKETQKAIEREPQRRDLKLALANFYVQGEQYDNAIPVYRELLAQEPKSANLMFLLAETERRKGDLNTAIDYYRQCSQAAPNDVSCPTMLGLLMEGTGRRDQAKPIWESILKTQPDNGIALNNLAFAKAESGEDLDQALTMAQRARQKIPNSPEIADTLGWVYIKKNLSDDAVRLFKDLTDKNPNNAIFRYHYGMALLQKGDKPSAKKELTAALALNPSKDDASKIRELLQKI